MAGVWGSIPRVMQQRVVSNPVLTALQLPPPSMLLKTPTPELGAERVVGFWGSMARALIVSLGGPLVVHALTPASARWRLTTRRSTESIRAVQFPLRPMVFAAGVCMWTPSESEADLSIRSRP